MRRQFQSALVAGVLVLAGVLQVLVAGSKTTPTKEYTLLLRPAITKAPSIPQIALSNGTMQAQ
jgi:hypothetical protein